MSVPFFKGNRVPFVEEETNAKGGTVYGEQTSAYALYYRLSHPIGITIVLKT
jgi:hypothetical protein